MKHSRAYAIVALTIALVRHVVVLRVGCVVWLTIAKRCCCGVGAARVHTDDLNKNVV